MNASLTLAILSPLSIILVMLLVPMAILQKYPFSNCSIFIEELRHAAVPACPFVIILLAELCPYADRPTYFECIVMSVDRVPFLRTDFYINTACST